MQRDFFIVKKFPNQYITVIREQLTMGKIGTLEKFLAYTRINST